MATETLEAHEGAEMVEAASGPGMPQLDFSTFPNQIFWLVIALVAIYLILTRLALPRIGSVLSERAGTITNDIAAAEELRHKAAQAEAAYTKALADARGEANKIIAAAKAEMQAELDTELARADAQIAARTAESERRLADIRDSAAANVAEVARDTAREIAALFGAGGNDAAVDAAVARAVKE